MAAESSDSNSASSLSGDVIAFNSPEAGETFISALRDHPRFCSWCLVPLEVNPTVQFTPEGPNAPLNTGGTYAEFGAPIEDVPPDKTDEQGVIVEHSREEQTICGSCGVIDVMKQDSRPKETTRQALRHIVSILAENDVRVCRFEAIAAVEEAFDKGHTGQFIETLGKAVYQATDLQ